MIRLRNLAAVPTARCKVIRVDNILTNGDNTRHTVNIVHNLNSRCILARPKYSATTGLCRNDWYQAGHAWGTFRGYYYTIVDVNTIQMTFCHDGNGGYYSQWVEILAVDYVQEA